jgi:antitoxin component HigA of HigAB toxin-antitoxin module
MNKYIALVENFPLVLIENKEHHRAALKVVGELSERESELTEDEFDYLKVLIALIDTYEKRSAVASAVVTPQEALTFLMEENNMKQIDICRGADIVQTHLSAFLSGTRQLTKTEIGKLSDFFKVSPLLFIDENYFGGFASIKKIMSGVRVSNSATVRKSPEAFETIMTNLGTVNIVTDEQKTK